MNISFWNTHRNKSINDFIALMIIENDIDIMIMAEYEDDIDSLINMLYVKEKYYNEVVPIACKKIKIIYRNNITAEMNNDCSNYVSLNVLKENLNFQLFATHFPSKLYSSDADRNIVARILKDDIENYNNALVVGDFNSNPFEITMSALSGLLALPTKEHETRTVQGVERKILYNPMWRFFGDFATLPGTYFYNNSNDLNYYWNIFDQVLVSQNLVNVFDNNKLEIIKKIDEKNLIKNNIIDREISDHLPIFFSLKEE